MSIAESEVRKILSPEREAKIRKAHDLAWQDWWQSPDRTKFSFWRRTRANMLFERLRHHMHELFKDDRGVHFDFRHQTFKVLFDQKLLVRFKKANGKGLGSNVLTQAVLKFVTAEGQLPGLPGVDKIEVVYALNVLNTSIDKIFVQARDGKTRLWAYEIGSDRKTDVVPLRPRTPPTSPPAGDLVTPRKIGRKDESKNNKE